MVLKIIILMEKALLKKFNKGEFPFESADREFLL